MTEKEMNELKEYNKKERDYFLGKTDVDPSTGKSRKQAQAEAEAQRIAFEAEEAKRAEKYAKRAEGKKGKTDDKEVSTPITDVVELPSLPTKEVLKKMEIKDLIALAVNRGVAVKANVDSKDEIIEKLYAKT